MIGRLSAVCIYLSDGADSLSEHEDGEQVGPDGGALDPGTDGIEQRAEDPDEP